MTRRLVAGSVLSLLALLGCDPQAGTGTVKVTTWGESLIEEGIGKELFPKDGWSVKYSRFLVVLHSVTIADEKETVFAELGAPLVYDMVVPGDKLVATYELEAKAWPHVSYQLGPWTNDAVASDYATESDRATLEASAAALHLEGTATSPEGTVKTFSWSFSTPTLYQDCHGEQDGKEVDGVVVTTGATEEVQITIHGDHLFYDDLQSDEAVPRFQALANADANDDGAITLKELDAVPLYTIPPELGSYGTGALGNVNTLGDYERTLARTVGHYRGEGSCNSRNVE